MTTLGIQYMQAKEAERSNKAKESNTLYQIDVQADTADKDRRSREYLSNLDRASKENIAAADRISKENIANADRVSNEMIQANRLASNESIAQKDRDSKEKIATQDRLSKMHMADADRLAKVQVARYDRNSKERIALADRLSKETIAMLDRGSKEEIAHLDRVSKELIESNKVTEQYYRDLVTAMNARGYSTAQASAILDKLKDMGAISKSDASMYLIVDHINDQSENVKDVLNIMSKLFSQKSSSSYGTETITREYYGDE